MPGRSTRELMGPWSHAAIPSLVEGSTTASAQRSTSAPTLAFASAYAKNTPMLIELTLALPIRSRSRSPAAPPGSGSVVYALPT